MARDVTAFNIEGEVVREKCGTGMPEEKLLNEGKGSSDKLFRRISKNTFVKKNLYSNMKNVTSQYQVNMLMSQAGQADDLYSNRLFIKTTSMYVKRR